MQDLYQYLQGQNWFDIFKSSGIRHVYYILGQSRALLGKSLDDEKGRELSKLIVENFEKNNAEVAEVRDDSGDAAFKIYKLKLN